MAKEEFKQEEKQGKKEVVQQGEHLIRILQTDIPGNKQIYAGLTRIKGISWSLSNAICEVLGINKKTKVEELSKEQIQKITEFVKKLQEGEALVPEYLLNRRKDYDTGKNKHLLGTDLDLRKEFDIKKLKKIRAYKGTRHSKGLPVRGQRTKSHFRKNKTLGVAKKKKGTKG